MKEFHTDTKLIALIKRMYYSPKFKWIRTWYYLRRYNKILNNIKGKSKIRIVFFVVNLSMWKYEPLVKLLLKNNRFDVVIIPYPYPWHTKEEQLYFEAQIVDYCKQQGFPYRIAYNPNTKKYIPAEDLDADIVTYSQHYNGGYNFWKIEKFWNKSLFFCTPYGIPIDTKSEFNNTLLHNVSWKIFYPTLISKYVFESNPLTHGRNFVYVGNPIYDNLNDVKPTGRDWKINSDKLKRVIWAPHHSIGEDDLLPFSSFLKICDDMVGLAVKYRDVVQFVFKPHPFLKERLIKLWGTDKTEQYYKKWMDMPNTSYVSGEYIDLFKTSDAMIHDCASFMAEYLFTHKPILYISKPGVEQHLSAFSKLCYECHYKGRTIEDIDNFIREVVLCGNDYMLNHRETFFEKELKPPGNKSVAENMYDSFLEIL